MRKFLSLGLVVLLVFVVVPWSARAQDVTVIPQEIDHNKLPALEMTYLTQLENYRRQEQSYLIAVNQYHQLNTLASQEVAVVETKKLLTMRADVLLTYIDILDERLNQAKGIPLENKSPERVALSLLKEQVQTHKTAVQSAQDRLSVDNEAAHFLTTFRELESHTYYTLSLIKLGNMQVAYDKLKVTRDAVKAYVDTRPLSNTVRAEKQRGFDEIERNIQNADALFTPVKTEFYQQPGRGDLSSYSKLSTALNPVYAQINQVVQFLEEVKK